MPEERLYFFNSLPQLYQALKRERQEEKVLGMVSNFLKNSFNEDLQKADRFLKIPSIGFIPADMEYFKLYSELIQLYTNGLYYSTIVLAEVVCERICYDTLSKQRIRLAESETLSKEQIACLFEMNLFHLISLVHSWGLIKEETKKEMIEVNNKRNQYVHPKKGELDKQKDSLKPQYFFPPHYDPVYAAVKGVIRNLRKSR